MISVIIPTKDRPEKLRRCLQSIFANKNVRFEIIIVDQSTTPAAAAAVIKRFPLLQRKRIRYFTQQTPNKSRALNLAVAKSRYALIAFTDDDCIVRHDWLRQILLFFAHHPNVDGVFGSVFPYSPTKISGYQSPSCFTARRSAIVRDPYIIQHEMLGNGNNMAFRASTLSALGKPYFKEWLGDGSLCKAGGIENDVVFRLLKMGRPIAYQPTIIAYHNRWLNADDYQLLLARYCCGYSAFIIYHMVTGRDVRLYRLLSRMSGDSLREPFAIFLRNMGQMTKGAIIGLYEAARDNGHG